MNQLNAIPFAVVQSPRHFSRECLYDLKFSSSPVMTLWPATSLAISNYLLFVSAPKCRDVVLGSYVRGMSLVARAHNVAIKIDMPKST